MNLTDSAVEGSRSPTRPPPRRPRACTYRAPGIHLSSAASEMTGERLAGPFANRSAAPLFGLGSPASPYAPSLPSVAAPGSQGYPASGSRPALPFPNEGKSESPRGPYVGGKFSFHPMLGRALCGAVGSPKSGLETGCGDQGTLMSWFSPGGTAKFSPGGAPKAFRAAGPYGIWPWPNDMAKGSLPVGVVRPVGSGEELNRPATGPRIPPNPLDSAARAARRGPSIPPVEKAGAGALAGAPRSPSPGAHGGAAYGVPPSGKDVQSANGGGSAGFPKGGESS
jgi:hypothetical protein